MIYGIGCDLCQISRIEKSLTGPRSSAFVRRVYGQAEQTALGLPWADKPKKSLCRSAAADFAAKEAFLKAAGCGLGKFPLAEIQALRRDTGAPYYALQGQTACWMQENGLTAHLSLSHEGDTAMAVCVLEKT